MVRAGIRVSVLAWGLAAGSLALAQPAAPSGDGTTYKCPGNVYTNMISAQDAKARGCTTIEGAPITIVQTAKPRPAGKAAETSGGVAAPAAPPRASESRVDPAAQRQRDSDARRILESELAKEQDKLAAMHKEFNNGQPERRGDEQNYAKYQDRVAEMKAAIARKEGDIAAIKRELAKLPSP